MNEISRKKQTGTTETQKILLTLWQTMGVVKSLKVYSCPHKQLKGKVEVLDLKRYFLFIVFNLIILLSKINTKIV